MPSVSIVGGGIGGLATGSFLKRLVPDITLTVFEGSGQVGGRARSTREAGYTFDWGPSNFLIGSPPTTPSVLRLVEAVGLSQELVGASPAARRHYVFHDGGLRPAPTSLSTFLGSELLSSAGKLRLLLEPFIASRFEGEETVYSFLRRHFGISFADSFAGSLVFANPAGDARRLSLDALFPELRQLEYDHRSLIRAFDPQGLLPGGGSLTSFRYGGIQRLIDGLKSDLATETRTNAEVMALEKTTSTSIKLRFDDGAEVLADQVVLATPAFVSARLLKQHLPEAAQLLVSIPYADVRVFGLGYDRIEIPRPLDGFGFLVPRSEGPSILAVAWNSSIFPNRAPEGRVSLSVFVGGTQDPNFLSLSANEALAAIRSDLEITMGITAAPEYISESPRPQAIPQYLLGHGQRVKRIEVALAGIPGIYLTGGAYRGVGLDACIRDAYRVAKVIAADLVES
jgi:oxygen-dependent protoporphyrinogen oxidase